MMTPQEKWTRIRDPKCAEDYGLELTLDEMREVPELAPLVELVEDARREVEEREEYKLLAEAAGKDAGEVIDKMAREILVKGIVPVPAS